MRMSPSNRLISRDYGPTAPRSCRIYHRFLHKKNFVNNLTSAA